jgi:hypothetical protein
MRYLPAATAILVVATNAAAQQPQRAAGDTLVFQEVIRTSGEMQGTQVSGEVKYLLYLTRFVGDSAEAWFDSASFVSSTPMPAPLDVSTLNRQKMIVHFLPDGRVTGFNPLGGGGGASRMATPSFNNAASFVLPMPRGGLRRGVTWTDTATMKVDTLGFSMTMTNVTNYEAVGDSTYDGQPVVIVAARGTIKAEGGGGDMNLQTRSEGELTGRLFYSPALGFVVRRVAEAQMKSSMNAAGMSLQMSNRMDQDLKLVRRK